jgi:hypothetical protein
LMPPDALRPVVTSRELAQLGDVAGFLTHGGP